MKTMRQRPKVLVTGGAGFIGSHIVDRLIQQSYPVVIVDNLSTGKLEHLNPQAAFYFADITDRGKLQHIFAEEKPEYVIHHAAQIDVKRSISEPFYDAQINVLGTINVLEHCVKYGVRKVIYASSAAVYGNPEYLGVDEYHWTRPISFYGISKFTPEHYIRVFSNLYGLNYTILRYANVYGDRQDPKGEGGVVSIFSDKLRMGEKPAIYGDGSQTRDFIYVSDIAQANICALHYGDRQTFNISCGVQTSVNELLRMMNEITGKQMTATYKEAREGDILHSYLNNEKAKKELRWIPAYTLYEGLTETLEYYFSAAASANQRGGQPSLQIVPQ